MPKVHHQDSPISRCRFLEYLELANRLRNSADTRVVRIANAGSIASAFGTEKTKCAIGWKPPTAKSENGWNIAFAKSTKNESAAGAGDQRSPVTNAWPFGEGSGAGLGDTLDAAPHAGLGPGPDQ
jgi:hypothetical protein